MSIVGRVGRLNNRRSMATNGGHYGQVAKAFVKDMLHDLFYRNVLGNGGIV